MSIPFPFPTLGLVAALLLGTSAFHSAPARADDDARLRQAVELQVAHPDDPTKREEAFAILQELAGKRADDPLVHTHLANALSLKAKYATATDQKIFWSKRSDMEFASVLERHPQFLLARASRAVNYSLSPPFLGLDRAAEADFEEVLAQGAQPKDDNDVEALILTYRYYAGMLERRAAQGIQPDQNRAHAAALNQTLAQRFPKAAAH